MILDFYFQSKGPAVLKGNQDKLVGVASNGNSGFSLKEIFDETEKTCGPLANDGKGYWHVHISNYIDVARYSNWIKNTIEKNKGIIN